MGSFASARFSLVVTDVSSEAPAAGFLPTAAVAGLEMPGLAL